MTKIKIKIGKESVQKGMQSGDFEDPPAGLYVVRITRAEQRQKEGGEFPYINVAAFPVGKGRGNEKLDPPEGVVWGTVWDKVSLSPAAEWRLTKFCLAMGMTINARGELVGSLELDEDKTGSIIGKLALLRVKGGENLNGDYRAEAGNWYPYEAVDNGEGFEDLEDEDVEEEEEPEDEPDLDEDEDEVEEEEYWTADSLDALDNDELKKAAVEFDLDTTNFRVYTGRGKAKKLELDKTREAIITAILDAQGVEEGDSSDEEPF